jgi:trimeric autotransporter adhesin
MKWFTRSRCTQSCSSPAIAFRSLAIAALFSCGIAHAAPLGTSFTYQGFLSEASAPAQGAYDLRFILYNAEIGGSQVGNILTNLNLAVNDGLVTAHLDFSTGIFEGDAFWLEIAVRPGGASSPFVALSPRQPIRPTPYATHAVTAGSAFTATTATTASTATMAAQVPWEGISGVPEGFADGIDHDTTYSAGDGLELLDSVFALADGGVGPGKIDASSADAGQMLLFDGATVVWTNLTLYHAGDGLALADETFSVLFDGSGSAPTAARGDHSHPPGDAATLSGLPADAFAPAEHTHALDTLEGTLPDDHLSGNVALRNADQSFLGANTFTGPTLLTNQANVVHGSFNGDGTGLLGLQGTALANESLPGNKIAPGSVGPERLNTPAFNVTFWKTDGNSGTIAGPSFLGTTDDEPLELHVNGRRVLRLEPNGTNTVNLLAGSPSNDIDTFTIGATIAGGGATTLLGFPHANKVYGNFSTISGGSRNLVEPTAEWSTISGGLHHTIELNAQWSTIAGGHHNLIDIDADYATIGGGRTNTIHTGAHGATIAGGSLNSIGTNSLFATIPGGHRNQAVGRFSFAAGHQARALHDGSLVWADATDQPVASTETNQITFRASGGVRIFSDSNLTTGVELEAGSGTWTTLSDRNTKTNFEPVDPTAVLNQVTQLPVHYWNYRAQDPATRHLGPVAQDFHSAFGLGNNPRRIATVDADGVALAAIQGLNLKLETELEARDRELKQLRQEMATLTARFEQLAGAVSTAGDGLRTTNP